MIGLLRHFGMTVIASFALFSIAPTSAPAASMSSMMTPQTTLNSFVGGWSCTTHTSDNKTYHESDVDTMYGKWIKISASFPAQEGQAAATGTAFLGYDAKMVRWYFTNVDTLGNYGSAYSTSKNFGGSTWHDGYPDNHGSATISWSKNQYTVDGKGPNEKGQMTTSHEVCTRT
jgi:hypothetical protein